MSAVANEKAKGQKYILPDCGVMNRFWDEIGFDYELEGIAETTKEIEPHDDPWICGIYDKDLPRRFAETCCEILNPQPMKGVHVVIIQRTVMNGYENQPAKFAQAGGERRWIQNMKEVFEVCEKYEHTRIDYLENKTLKEQIELFMSASAIVIQHGASFFNTVFCKPNTPVIEITRNNYFQKPAKWFGVNRLPCQYGNTQKSAVVNLDDLEGLVVQNLT